MFNNFLFCNLVFVYLVLFYFVINSIPHCREVSFSSVSENFDELNYFGIASAISPYFEFPTYSLSHSTLSQVLIIKLWNLGGVGGPV